MSINIHVMAIHDGFISLGPEEKTFLFWFSRWKSNWLWDRMRKVAFMLLVSSISNGFVFFFFAQFVDIVIIFFSYNALSLSLLAVCSTPTCLIGLGGNAVIWYYVRKLVKCRGGVTGKKLWYPFNYHDNFNMYI